MAMGDLAGKLTGRTGRLPRIILVVIIIIAFAALGSYLLQGSKAAGPFVSAEPEAGTPTSAACTSPDTAASGGQAVRFGCATGGQQARRTADFIDTLGVNVHMDYGRYANSTEVIDDLNYMGFRHVRDNSGNNAQLPDRRAMGAAGIKFHYTALKNNTITIPYSVVELKSYIDRRISDILDNNLLQHTISIEAFNEFDHPGAHNNDPVWFTKVREIQQYLYAQAKLRLGPDFKVLGFGLIGKDLATKAEQVGDISANMDYGNMHSYPGGDNPDSSFPDKVPSQANFQSPTTTCAALSPSNTVDERLRLVATCMSKAKPMMITETGYHTDGVTTVGHKWTSEAAMGTYIPRLFLDNFRIGVTRTYSYELLDQGVKTPTFEGHIGLFKVTGEPKQAATGMRTLTTLLADPAATSASFQPGALNYTLSGTTAGIHKVLMQKSDGSFWLALWNDAPVWNNQTFTDLTSAPVPVTLTLGNAATATAYRNNTTVASALGAGTSFPLSIGPKVTLVKIQ